MGGLEVHRCNSRVPWRRGGWRERKRAETNELLELLRSLVERGGVVSQLRANKYIHGAPGTYTESYILVSPGWLGASLTSHAWRARVEVSTALAPSARPFP